MECLNPRLSVSCSFFIFILLNIKHSAVFKLLHVQSNLNHFHFRGGKLEPHQVISMPRLCLSLAPHQLISINSSSLQEISLLVWRRGGAKRWNGDVLMRLRFPTSAIFYKIKLYDLFFSLLSRMFILKPLQINNGFV